LWGSLVSLQALGRKETTFPFGSTFFRGGKDNAKKLATPVQIRAVPLTSLQNSKKNFDSYQKPRVSEV